MLGLQRDALPKRAMPFSSRPLALALAIQSVLALTFTSVANAQATWSLGSLDGARGFKLDGELTGDRAGFSVSRAGDVNGDGLDDLIIGAIGADPNGQSFAGRSYVVFGRTAGFSSPVPLSSLNGSNGFILDGETANWQLGDDVSAAGDINGDGFDDLLLSASTASPNGLSSSGRSYVVFGRANFDAVLTVSSLNGSDGFKMDGETASSQLGRSTSAVGDLNADGMDDFVVCGPGTTVSSPHTGRCYLVYGRATTFSSTLALSGLNGITGFKLDGEAGGNSCGRATNAAGDINGDGLDDLIIGASNFRPYGPSPDGRSYVVFGNAAGFSTPFRLSNLSGNLGVKLDGEPTGSQSGTAVSAIGDINGDGLDDVAVGASEFSNTPDAGRSYVVFGRAQGFGFDPVALSALNGGDGFKLGGEAVRDYAGTALGKAGDINGDGLEDLIVGSRRGRVSSNGIFPPGRSYVLFGSRSGFAPTIALSSLDGNSGIKLDGETNGDVAGMAVDGVGDVNGDGLDDLIVGAPYGRPNGALSAGRGYVVFGERETIFRDGTENENLQSFFPLRKIKRTAEGSAVRWQNGARCDCNLASFNFNVNWSGTNMTFQWPRSANGNEGAVGINGTYSVLNPGATVGPSSTFTTSGTTAATANWRAGANNYLGFRFLNDAGQVRYGYAHVRTTAPTGFPVEVISVHLNLTGQAITVVAD